MNILITGEKGYISSNLYEYLQSTIDGGHISKKSVRNKDLHSLSLEKIDVLIHPAAIVHNKETLETEKSYYQVNTELTRQLAMKAKLHGVKQFIFFSTMAVYGISNGEISESSSLNPETYYGKSKLAAEEVLLELQDENFKVAIIRPPMVYGPNCPGNYALLSKLSRKTFIFPKVENKRSMIYINNLTDFVYQLILNKESGIYHPQDPQFINTSLMVQEISNINKKKIYFSKLGTQILKILIGNKSIYKKVFGDLYYNEELSRFRDNSYQKYKLLQAIEFTEKGNENERS